MNTSWTCTTSGSSRSRTPPTARSWSRSSGRAWRHRAAWGTFRNACSRTSRAAGPVHPALGRRPRNRSVHSPGRARTASTTLRTRRPRQTRARRTRSAWPRGWSRSPRTRSRPRSARSSRVPNSQRPRAARYSAVLPYQGASAPADWPRPPQKRRQRETGPLTVALAGTPTWTTSTGPSVSRVSLGRPPMPTQVVRRPRPAVVKAVFSTRASTTMVLAATCTTCGPLRSRSGSTSATSATSGWGDGSITPPLRRGTG